LIPGAAARSSVVGPLVTNGMLVTNGIPTNAPITRVAASRPKRALVIADPPFV
jgi:hypothetical protein